MQVRKMRLLRLKYNITRKELGNICGMSPQRISEIELDAGPVMEENTEKRLLQAFDALIGQRRTACDDMLRDYQSNKTTLMESVEEIGYEL